MEEIILKLKPNEGNARQIIAVCSMEKAYKVPFGIRLRLDLHGATLRNTQEPELFISWCRATMSHVLPAYRCHAMHWQGLCYGYTAGLGDYTGPLGALMKASAPPEACFCLPLSTSS